MKKILSLLFIASIAFSCTDDDIKTEQNFASGPKVVGFQKSQTSIAYFEDLGVKSHDLPLNLIGLGNGQYSESDIVVTYEVDPSSTAQEGVEFDFAGVAGQVVIPAGTNFGIIPIDVNTGQLDPLVKTELILNLTITSPGSVIGDQYKKLTVIFVGCETNLEGTYTNVSGSRTAVITKIEPNVYNSSYMPAFSSYYWFQFSDVCGDLSILDWQFQGGNPMTPTVDSGDGFVHGIIETNGDLTFSGANVAGVSWYVNLTWTLVKQ